jgi:hypothetical protein
MQGSALAPIDQQPSEEKKSKAPRGSLVTPKVKVAIDDMIESGTDWTVAARNANLTVRAMRKALEKPTTLRYLKERKQVFRAQVSAGNIRRLAEIRDAADNMPAVNAIRMLEELDEDPAAKASSARVPGFVIMIGAQVGAVMAPVSGNDAKPLIENASVQDDEA